MAFQNQTNPRRVQHIVDMLDLIEKSATANNVGPGEVRAMIEPVLKKLVEMRLGNKGQTRGDEAAAPQRKQTPLTAGERAAQHLADKASLRELIASLIGRLEAHAERIVQDEN